MSLSLTLKAPITTAADDIQKYFFHCFSEKIRLDVSSESSARQRIHIKNQALFSLKYKSKKIKISSAAIFVWGITGERFGNSEFSWLFLCSVTFQKLLGIMLYHLKF